MRTLAIREIRKGVLVGLAEVVESLAPGSIERWHLRDVEFRNVRPFGMDCLEFERLTRELEIGFVVSDRDFRRLLESDLQMIDGCIEAWDSQGMAFSLSCFDSSEWEVSTDREEFIQRVRQRFPSSTTDLGPR